MKRLSQTQKQDNIGGSFYAIALGIGILVSTVSSLAANVVTSVKASKGETTTDAFGGQRRSTMIRLSPVPSRSSVMIF